MKKISLLAAVVLALGLVSSPGLAQSTKIFLASTGVDTNDGSRASPKRTLQAGHDAVAAGGEVVILDTAGYGPVTITKSVGVIVPPGVNGFITVTSGNGVTINAGAGDTVLLRGLIVEGPGSSGGNGIYATSLKTLIVEDCLVRRFAEGVFLNAAVSSQLVMRRSAVLGVDYGVDVEAITNGVRADGVLTDVLVDNSTSSAIFSATASVGSTKIVATRCVVTNSNRALQAQGSANAQIVADGCTISGNGIGYSTFSGGVIYSRGNNTLYNNTNDGTATTLNPK